MAEAKKPWTWAARIAAMPPIDWAALAIEERAASRWCRRGDKRSVADVMAGLEVRERNRRRRHKAALKRLEQNYVAAAHRHRQFVSVFTLAHRIALAMQPGDWYGKSDVWRLTDLRQTSVKAKMSDMCKRGLLRRVRNPDWHPQRMLAGEGVHCIAFERREPPLWLYRLTPLGEALRREAEWLA